jgi:parvulin-like peptidyl-prolyl isomerase
MAISVNGERIESDAIREEAERMRPQFEEAFADEEPEAREAKLLEWARENVIERTLLTQEATRDPRPVAAKKIQRALKEAKQHAGEPKASDQEIKANVELRLRIDRIIKDVCKGVPSPSDEAIRQYYAEHTDEFLAPEQIRVAHIVKHVDLSTDPETARAALAEVREALEQGANFAGMAAKHSDCPDNGGDLGYFARGQMVEEFEHLVFSLPVGQLSQLFPTRFGFHIAKVLDRKPPSPRPFEEVKGQIRDGLTEELRNKAIEDHLDQLRAKAAIEEV